MLAELYEYLSDDEPDRLLAELDRRGEDWPDELAVREAELHAILLMQSDIDEHETLSDFWDARESLETRHRCVSDRVEVLRADGRVSEVYAEFVRSIARP